MCPQWGGGQEGTAAWRGKRGLPHPLRLSRPGGSCLAPSWELSTSRGAYAASARPQKQEVPVQGLCSHLGTRLSSFSLCHLQISAVSWGLCLFHSLYVNHPVRSKGPFVNRRQDDNYVQDTAQSGKCVLYTLLTLT